METFLPQVVMRCVSEVSYAKDPLLCEVWLAANYGVDGVRVPCHMAISDNDICALGQAFQTAEATAPERETSGKKF